MSSFISIYTNEDSSEVGPTVDEERVLFTVEPVGSGPGSEDTAVHFVTDGAHGLWTILVRLSPAAKARLITSLGGTPSGIGELGLSYLEAGSVAQALGQVVIDRERATRDEVLALFRETGPEAYREEDLWDKLGEIADAVEDDALAKAGKQIVNGEVVPS